MALFFIPVGSIGSKAPDTVNLVAFPVILGHSWPFHVMEQARGVSWGIWLILRKLFKAIARKSSPNYLNLLVSIRFTLLPNSKTRWTARRRGFPRLCKKQAFRLKNTLPKMAPSRYWAPAPARKAPRLSFSIRAVTW